jgi:hypothetical protein
MNRISVENWFTSVHHLLMWNYNFIDEQASELLSGEWTDAFYDMWKEGYSCEKAAETIADENQPWNIK